MKRRMILFMLALTTLTASANDGVYFTSGNFLVPIQETTISVAKEILTITIGKDSLAKVDVYYEFLNPDTISKTVTMAFEASAPYNVPFDVTKSNKHPYIYNFTVMMNGLILPCKNSLIIGRKQIGENTITDFTTITTDKWKAELPKNHEKGDVVWPGELYNAELDSTLSVDYGYFFTAEFRPGINKVHHTYNYMMSYNNVCTYEIPYWLTPATRWANHQIDDFTLRIKNENETDYTIVDSLFTSAPFQIKNEQGEAQDSTGILYPFRSYIDGKHITLVSTPFNTNVMEWHAKDFAPTSDLSIVSADRYLLNKGAWTSERTGMVVVDKNGEIEGRYLGDNDDTYLIDAQDFGYVSKKESNIVEYSAEKGQGIVYLKDMNGHSINVRQRPSKKSPVVGIIKDKVGEIPETFECLGIDHTPNKNSDYTEEWYRIKIKGRIGYVLTDLMIWDSIDTY